MAQCAVIKHTVVQQEVKCFSSVDKMCFRAQGRRARACIKKLLVLKQLKIQIVTFEEHSKYIQIKTIWSV